MKETDLSGALVYSNAGDMKMSRRKLLMIGAGLTAGYVAGRVGRPIIDQKYDEWLASLNNEDFVKHFEKDFQKIRFGTSFAPEQFGISLHDQGRKDGRFKRAMDALEFATQDIRLRSVRLGIRWNNSVDEAGEIDFSLYGDFVDTLLNRGVRVCPNFGYKVLRWPEEHVPETITNSGMMPDGKRNEITLDSELGKATVEHTEKMAAFLKKEYGDVFPTVQIENEPKQHFGNFENTLSDGILSEGVRIAREFFPSAQILYNAGPSSIGRIADFVEDQIASHPELSGVFKAGVDLHFENPKVPRLLQAIGIDTMTIHEIVDGRIFDDLKDRSDEYGYTIEASEVQIENWGNLKSPLYSQKKMKKAIARTVTDVLKTGEDDPVTDLRLWGIEDQFKVLMDEEVTWDTEQRVRLLRHISEVAA